MSTSVKVKLVNFRNPEEIYIKFLEGDKARNHEGEARKVNRIERELARLAKKTEKINYVKSGEIYGCFVGLWKKWVRGKVISKQKSNGYTVFCIDHGYYKTNTVEFMEIPDEIKSEKTQTYYKVSLGLTPLNMNRWTLETIGICRKFVEKDNINIHFVPFFEDSNQFFGDLFLFEGDDHYSLSEKLISLGLASKPTTDFNKIFNMLHGKEIGPLKTVQPIKRLEMYKSDPEMTQKVLTTNIQLPKNLILHGNDLKPFWNSIDDSNFHNFLRKKFSYKNEHLNDIQKVVWPQITNGNHLFVISSNQDCLTSIYILPLINKLINRVKGDRFGSSVIIFANCSSRIDEIAMQCENYAKQNISIIKAVGMCKNKLVDLMNGCDILITTPPAFIRLIQSASYKIIDVDTLKHVVFDNFDQNSLNLFDKELNAIIKSQYASKIPQTIIVSKTYSNGLKTKILNHLPASETVIKCMDNYLDAAAFVGLSISIEISAHSNDKINKLTKTSFDSYKKNLIVVSNTETMSILEEKLESKAIKCDSSKIAEIWDNSSPNNVLIINDTILNDSIIQNADNLIHYDLPFNLCLAITTSDQFSKRFKVFHNEIYKRLNSQEEASALRTKIILSNENVSQFEELINLLIGRNLLKANEKVIEKIYEKNEALKCINKVSLCQNLTQFGDCMKLNCVNRHKLSEQDMPPIHLEIYKNFISFDLISQQGPTTFVIKIREYYDNKWISCVQSNEYIQQKLDVDMQRYCNEKSNALTLNEGKVGEIYAKYDNKLGKWIRGRMIKRNSLPIVELNLLDNLPDIPSTLQSLLIKCHEKNLVKLPEEFTKLNPLLSKLQIMNLIPLDGEKSYNKNNVDKLNNLMSEIPKHAKFYAKIETIIGDVMFSKNIEAKNDKKAVIFRLTEAHSKLGISGTDEKVCKRILELSSAINKDPVENEQEELVKDDQNQNLTQNFFNLSVEPLKFWKQLKHYTAYSIIVKEYISPYSFFAVLINHENLTIKNNLKAIEDSHDHKQLISININECCLFNSNNRYLRAVILNILEDSQIKILLVDYGEIQKCDEKSLFEIPKEFLNLNFQAVHCSMLGICPKFNLDFWPPLQQSYIHNLISKYNGKSLKMLVVKDDQKKHQFSEIGISSYDVMLYDDESKSYLSKLSVKQRIASECSEYNDDFYESTDDDQDDDDLMMDTSSWFSDIYGSEMLESENAGTELADSAVAMSNDSAEISSSTSPAYTMSIKSSASTESVSTNNTMSIKSTDSMSIASSVKTPSSSLKSIFKLPHIEWRQTNFMIYLLISANDCTEYALSINETSLDVVIKYQDNKIERTIIQLYGSVKPKFCSHELAGIKIIVRLAKKLYGPNWPRLTMSKEKSIYIKFNDASWNLNIDEYQSDASMTAFLDVEDDDKESNNDFETNLSSEDELY